VDALGVHQLALGDGVVRLEEVARHAPAVDAQPEVHVVRIQEVVAL
jgi:hypothetical protein